MFVCVEIVTYLLIWYFSTRLKPLSNFRPELFSCTSHGFSIKTQFLTFFIQNSFSRCWIVTWSRTQTSISIDALTAHTLLNTVTVWNFTWGNIVTSLRPYWIWTVRSTMTPHLCWQWREAVRRVANMLKTKRKGEILINRTKLTHLMCHNKGVYLCYVLKLIYLSFVYHSLNWCENDNL